MVWPPDPQTPARREEILYAALTLRPDGTWFGSAQNLAGDTFCGRLELPAPDDADRARDRYDAMLRREFGVDEAIAWERAADGWGANLRGSARLREHDALAAAARPEDARFVRALGAGTKQVVETGAVDAAHLARTMRRRAARLADDHSTIGPIDRYLADLARVCETCDHVVHVICMVTHPEVVTVHSAVLAADRTVILASFDHVLDANARAAAGPPDAESGV